jgi:hypothetical protein
VEAQTTMYDDCEWTPAETGLLAGEAFSKLDDTNYSDYLKDFVESNPEATGGETRVVAKPE